MFRAIWVLAAAAMLAWPSAAHAQSQPVFQSGTMIPGALAKFYTNGLIGPVSGSPSGGVLGDPTTGRGANPFGIMDGSGSPNVPGIGLCSNSAVTSGAYNALCIGHDASSRPLITVDSYGGLADKDLIFRINGTSYIFPGPGAGTILGPITSTVGNLVVWNNTAGTLSKDGGPAAPTYPTLAALKAAPGNIAPLVYRAGYYAAGDAPALLYRWSASVCTIAAGAGDNGAEVKPDVGSGCWLAQFTTDDRDVRQWGAVCDNTANDSPAFAAALARGKTITVPPQTCKLTAGLSITASGQVVRGSGANGTILKPVGNFDVFSFSGGGEGGGIENMRIDGTGMTGGHIINVNAYHRSHFNNLNVVNPYNFAFMQGINVISFNDLFVLNILGSYGFKCNGPTAARSDVIQMANIVMSGALAVRPDGIVLDGSCFTLNIQHVGMSAYFNQGLWLKNTVGATLPPLFIQADDLEIEFANQAIRLDAGGEIKFINSEMSASALFDGIFIAAGVYGVGIVNSTISFNCLNGIATDGGTAAGGIILSGNRIESNGVCTAATYSGIFASGNSRGLVVNGNNIRGAHLIGLAIAAGASAVVASGNDYTGSTTAWVDNSGSATTSLGPDVGSLFNQFGSVKVGLISGISTVQAYSSVSANAQMRIAGAGTGTVVLANANGVGFLADTVASAVNYLGTVGTISGVSPGLFAAGPGANIGMQLTPKGTGLVQFSNAASFTAASNCGSLAGSLGCLTIMDASGGTRYVPYY